MTARLVCVPPTFQPSVSAWINQRSRKKSSHRIPNRSNEAPRGDSSDRTFSKAASESDTMSQDTLWRSLLDSIPQGVFVVSQTLQPIYSNSKAETLFHQIRDSEQEQGALPVVVTQLCQRLIQEEMTKAEPLVLEYQRQPDLLLRLQVRWLNTNSEGSLLMVLIEDCYATLREELELEQKKYDLTDRETEIWFFLRQEYTYQEISDLLKISLNTVKTHVKNVYAKRKGLSAGRKTWYSR